MHLLVSGTDIYRPGLERYDLKLSTRSRYGTRLILELARNFSQHPVQLAGIAQRQNISIKYLEQIIRPLQEAGYITSIRGPKGGHMLTKDPQDLTVGEIVALLEGGNELIQCAENPDQCRRADTCATRYVWLEAARAMYNRINEITFADLLNLTDKLCRENTQNPHLEPKPETDPDNNPSS